MRQFHQVDSPHPAQEPLGRVANPEDSLRVAGWVKCDPVRKIRADVLDAELVHQERRELVDPRDQLADGPRQRFVLGQGRGLGINLVDHPHA